MAGRSRSTFKKSQKEIARKEKQSQKAERRMQRKVEKLTQPQSDGIDWSNDHLSLDDTPLDLNRPGEDNPRA